MEPILTPGGTGIIGPKIKPVKEERPLRKLVIFASGSGTNAEKIITHFQGSGLATVSLIVCNNPKAGVIEVASRHGIPVDLIDRKRLNDPSGLSATLLRLPADLIVLAGFLWKVPDHLVRLFQGKILNIHPALLPKFGGKGMFGNHVHEAVVRAGENLSGITIHLVNERYDEGPTLLQRTVPVDPSDTPVSLAQKVQKLEHEWYPQVIEQFLKNNP